MAETLTIDPNASKAAQYQALYPQLKGLVTGEPNFTANVANLMAALKQSFGWLWVGCYFVDGDTLVLGPFQGPVACTRLFPGKGVCAAAWERNEAVVVEDVDAFPGHVACSSASRSEVVLPIRNGQREVIGVLDVDSDQLAAFDATDAAELLKVADLIGICHDA